MKDRPKLKLDLTTTDKIIELTGWAALVGIWILTLLSYPTLPETIPTHYSGAGEADAFGDKTSILALPIVSTILFLGMSVLNKYPHVFNYLNEITEENALAQYTTATRMIRFLKLVIVIILGLIVFRTTQNVNGATDGLGVWFVPLILALIIIPVAYYMTKANRSKKRNYTGSI